MSKFKHYFSDPENQDMTQDDIQTLIASRLEDMAEQIEILYSQGNHAEAELLRDEGLELAEAYDAGTTFLFISDLTEV